MANLLSRIPKAFKLGLKIIITTGLIFYLFQSIKLSDIQQLFMKSNLLYLLLAFVIYLVSQAFSSWRLLAFLKDVDIRLGFGYNFRLYLLGFFYNIFLPGGIGGDGYKIFLLSRRYKKSVKEVGLALFFDRLSGLWAIGLIALLLMYFLPSAKNYVNILSGIFILGSLLYYFVMRQWFRTYSGSFLLKHFRACIVQLFMVFCILSIIASQAEDVNFIPYVFSFLLSAVVGMINIGIGGLGVRDVFMAKAALVLDINQSLNVFISLTFWLISFCVALLGLWPVFNSKEFEPLPDDTDNT